VGLAGPLLGRGLLLRAAGAAHPADGLQSDPEIERTWALLVLLLLVLLLLVENLLSIEIERFRIELLSWRRSRYAPVSQAKNDAPNGGSRDGYLGGLGRCVAE
jgi:hypothetical protein